MDTSDIDFTTRIGSGGTADVYAVNAHPDIVAKLYNQPHKINFDKLKVLSDRLSGEPFSAHIAIPLELVSGPGGLIGFTQRYFDNTNYLELDYWIEGPLRKMLSPVQRGLHFRLVILRSLADLIGGLHGNHIAIVDLKPSNILVHRVTGQVAIVDCDAFCILDANGRIEYPAQEVTVGYCNGDALRKGTPPSQLSYKQDSFAFAVIAFQLLNNGIHPYQGVIQADVTDHNLEALTKGGVYPYGQSTPTQVTPLPISVHATLPSVLLEAFERSFERGRKHLDIARWSKLFSNILENNLVEQCPDPNRTGIHWKFSGHPCSDCTFDTLTQKTIPPKQTRNRNTARAKTPAKPQQTATAQTAPRTQNKTNIPPGPTAPTTPSYGFYKWVLGCAAIAVFVLILNGAFEVKSIQDSPTPKIDLSGIAPEPAPTEEPAPTDTQPPEPEINEASSTARLSPADTCRNALNPTKTDWDTRPIFAVYVAEAKSRGYTVSQCQITLKINVPTTDAQPDPADTQIPSTTASDGDHLKSLSEINVCGGALDPSKTDWDNRPNFVNVANEAKRRGYTIDSCRVSLGLPLQQPTTSKPFNKATSCDIEGSDAGIFKNTLLSDCEAKCSQNSSCQAFVYNKWNSLCILKSTTAPKIMDVSADCYFTGSESGFDKSRVWYFKELSNRRFTNASISNIVTASTLAACRKACNDDDQCFGANFNRAEGRCELLNHIQSSSTPDDGFDALYVYTPR